jgi:hypothetical protein
MAKKNARMRQQQSMDEAGYNLFASGLSGAISITAMNPLDCLRVRWQVTPPKFGLKFGLPPSEIQLQFHHAYHRCHH